jgi:tRNA1Val (adenine37-N6)-methyltransferase
MNNEQFTTDEIRNLGLKIQQPRDGYRFSLDPLILVDFASQMRRVASVADLGTGSGIMALMLCKTYQEATACGFESNPEMAALAENNAAINGLSDRVSIICDDILHHKQHQSDSCFDLVISNPPFRTPGSGRISPRKGRDTARHESTAGLADFLKAAKFLVKPSGRICFIHLPSRLAEFIHCAAGLKLSLTRLRMVHGTPDTPATMFMAELAKGSRAETMVMPPLVIRETDGGYTEEAGRIIGQQRQAKKENPA